jgi:predicted enzyme related to lactoylglutathione lyase
MTEKHYNLGHFVWRELIAADVEAAKRFYGELLGWRFGEMPMGDGPAYTLIQVGEKMVGGMMPPPMPGMPSHWMSYVSVDDVDAATARVKAHGGSVAAGPMDIAVGRLAVVADPSGAHFTLWRSKDGDGGPVDRPALGEFCWETLSTPSGEGAQAFYPEVLGWKQGVGPAPDMLVFNAGELPVADVQVTTDMPPHWLTYVVVADAVAAREHAEKLGAHVIVPLIPVPGVGNIAIIADPVGGVVGLFEAHFPEA